MNIVFRNKGTIDPRSITTFGVSSKENSSAIGYFGTGLKYAIAILLREGCTIEIHTGGQRLEFATVEQKVRVDEFTFVTMNGQPLAFTTELGKTWKMWQAIREIWCNCLDEKGEALATDDAVIAEDAETVIIVSGREALEAWSQRDAIMIPTKPIVSTENVDIHPGRSNYIYYKGVRIHELGNQSMFTYNLKGHVELTEDRTMKHPGLAGWYVAKGAAQIEDRAMIERIVTAPDSWFEHRLDFDPVSPSEAFCGVVRSLARSQVLTLNRTASRAANFNPDDMLDERPAMELTKVDRARLDRAIAFAHGLGFAVSEYPIVCLEHLGEGVLGRAANEKIYLSKTVFMQGTKMVAGTLIEEFIHLRHKLHDETRAMQNFLFDALVSAGEQITGEPL